MTERLLVAAVVLAGLSGVPGLFLRKGAEAGERIAVALLAVAALSGVTAAFAILKTGAISTIDFAWQVPGGRGLLAADALSAMFLVPIFVIALLSSIYGLSYWSEKEHEDSGRKLRFFFGLATSGLALVVLAKNSVLFLLAWEIMAVAAYFLVTTEDRDPEVRRSGFVYLVATRIGTLCLFAFFALLHETTGTFDFALPAGITVAPGTATALFLLGLIGFGLKAGIMPLHLWLPGAHANAPSHVSALMSCVLIKMGVYGLLRVTALFPHPPAWWGGLLLALGAISGILGVAFAVGQRDIKRILAYSSVENVGIMTMGLGLSELGRTLGKPELTLLGLAGTLLHVWNHSIFKGMLFFGAGAVMHATGTRNIDRLGGLAKKTPIVAGLFVFAAVAISGLPPLNGFVSEYLLYMAMFRATTAVSEHLWIAAAFGAPALALIGALAVACFVRVFGAVFLGEPRTADGAHAHEPSRSMLLPMALLAFAGVVIGLAPVVLSPVLVSAVSALAGAPAVDLNTVAPLGWLSTVSGLLVGLTLGLALLLRALSPRSAAPTTGTWDCGYRAPSSSMQYTASSFSEMLVGFFRWGLMPKVRAPVLRGVLPAPSSFHTEIPDVVLDRAAAPAIRRIADFFGWFKWVQQGNIHAYILYVLVALIVSLFVWR